jgi:hypothetical protein
MDFSCLAIPRGVLDRSVSVFYLNYIHSLGFTPMRDYEIRWGDLGLYNTAQYIESDTNMNVRGIEVQSVPV